MSLTFAVLPPWQLHWKIQMKTASATFYPESRKQPLTTTAPAASDRATSFVRPRMDSAPALTHGWDIIHPNASQAENKFVGMAAGLASGDIPLLNARLNFFVKNEGKGAPRLEDFMMNNEPANVQVMFPRIVINFGSDDKGTAGQIEVVNGRIEIKKGAAVQDPKMLRLALQHAAVALSLSIARQEGNMPYAVAKLQEIQNLKVLSDASGQAMGS